MEAFLKHVFVYFVLTFNFFTYVNVVVSITFPTNGDSLAGSDFSITATINISEIVDVHTVNITLLDSIGSEQNAISEVVGNGVSELNPLGPVVSTLEQNFSNVHLSQAGVYTMLIFIVDIYGNNITLHRHYLLTIRSKQYI